MEVHAFVRISMAMHIHGYPRIPTETQRSKDIMIFMDIHGCLRKLTVSPAHQPPHAFQYVSAAGGNPPLEIDVSIAFLQKRPLRACSKNLILHCSKTLGFSVAGANGRLKIDDSTALLKTKVAGCSGFFCF